MSGESRGTRLCYRSSGSREQPGDVAPWGAAGATRRQRPVRHPGTARSRRRPRDAGSRSDQTGDGHLRAAGKREDLAVASRGPTAQRIRRVAFVSSTRSAGCAAVLVRRLDAIRRPPRRSIPRPARDTAGVDADADGRHGPVRSSPSRRAGRADRRRSPRVEVGRGLELERLLAVLPSSARVVLSSRRDPPIRLHRLRLADEVAEIRAGDLRFTRARRASAGCVRDRVVRGGAAALYRRTEGWAAGLRLAAISLGSHADPERFVAGFSGTDRAIGEYLMAEMFERQPGEVQSMLLANVACRPVKVEFADLLSGGSGSERTLLELEERTRSSCRWTLSAPGFVTTAAGGFPAPGAPPNVGR